MEPLRKKLIGRKGGFTLIELMIVVAIIGILSAIAIPMYANMQTRARIGRAQADMAVLASAFSIFAAHCGNVPGTIAAWPIATAAAAGATCALNVASTGPAQLTVASTDGTLPAGISAGPFLRTVPQPPAGATVPWTYAYARIGAGPAYTLTAVGDGQTIIRP